MTRESPAPLRLRPYRYWLAGRSVNLLMVGSRWSVPAC